MIIRQPQAGTFGTKSGNPSNFLCFSYVNVRSGRPAMFFITLQALFFAVRKLTAYIVFINVHSLINLFLRFWHVYTSFLDTGKMNA